MEFQKKELHTEHLFLKPDEENEKGSISFTLFLKDTTTEVGSVYVYKNGSIDIRTPNLKSSYSIEALDLVYSYVREHNLSPSMWLD